MDQETSGHGGGHGSALPQVTAPASWWPILLGVSVAILGLALFWAGSEDNEEATIPVLAGAAALVVVSAAMWAYEEGALGRKMRSHKLAESLQAKYTQVISFSIAEGQLEASQAEGGIIDSLKNAEGDLRNHSGFDDLRVSISADDGGSSQALVQTVWASREEFAGYDAAKGSLLDLISAAGEQVVPGSVQAFDMDVVRDEKESPVRFTMMHGVIALTALVVGGFLVGIIAGAVETTTTGAAVEPDGDPFLVISTDNKFDRGELKAPADTEVTFTLENEGLVLHNLAFYVSQGGDALADGAVGEFTAGGAVSEVTFTTPGPGEYYFQCDLHPSEMLGTFIVE